MPAAAKRARSPSPRVRLARRLSPAPLPDAPAPMLASLAAEPFDHPDLISEPKYDGLRVLTRFDGLAKTSNDALLKRLTPTGAAASSAGTAATSSTKLTASAG